MNDVRKVIDRINNMEIYFVYNPWRCCCSTQQRLYSGSNQSSPNISERTIESPASVTSRRRTAKVARIYSLAPRYPAAQRTRSF